MEKNSGVVLVFCVCVSVCDQDCVCSPYKVEQFQPGNIKIRKDESLFSLFSSEEQKTSSSLPSVCSLSSFIVFMFECVCVHVSGSPKGWFCS